MPAEFHTRRGRVRPGLTLFIVALAVLAVALSGLPWPLALVAWAVIGVAGYRAVRASPLHTIRLDAAGAASLDGVRGRLVGDAVTGAFVALHVVGPDKRVARALVFFDELEAGQFRALLATLRHGDT